MANNATGGHLRRPPHIDIFELASLSIVVADQCAASVRLGPITPTSGAANANRDPDSPTANGCDSAHASPPA